MAQSYIWKIPRNPQKTISAHKQVQQSGWILDQHTKVVAFLYTSKEQQQQKFRKQFKEV